MQTPETDLGQAGNVYILVESHLLKSLKTDKNH